MATTHDEALALIKEIWSEVRKKQLKVHEAYAEYLNAYERAKVLGAFCDSYKYTQERDSKALALKMLKLEKVEDTEDNVVTMKKVS